MAVIPVGAVGDGTPTSGPLGRRRVAGGWALAVLGSAGLTALLVPADDAATSLAAMSYLALAVACALVGGRWPAVAASVVGVLCLNWWFTEPLRTLEVATTADAVALVVFVAVSVCVGAVVDAAARRLTQARDARDEADTLQMLNRRVLGGEYDVPALLRVVREHFGAQDAELVLGTGPVAGADTAVPCPPDRVLVLRGVVLDPAGRRVLTAFATHLGVLDEREALVRQTEAARVLEAGARTRTALLAAVSHDLRTPLAGVRAASETLLRHHDRLDPVERSTLLEAVASGTERLTTLVADLLDMSRLQTGAVEPVLAATPLGDVVDRVLADLGAAADRVQVERPLPTAVVDAALLERVVANLLGNALAHTHATVQVAARHDRTRVMLEVVDHGSGVPVAERATMFEPFQKLGDADRGGVGLGLAVARGLTEAQGGLLSVHDTAGGGLTMTVELAAP